MPSAVHLTGASLHDPPLLREPVKRSKDKKNCRADVHSRVQQRQ